VTKQNIIDPEKVASKITPGQFLRWARERIKLPKKGEIEVDIALENVSKEIFPTVEPFFGATMLTFLMRP
jgi:hypothetical protein